MSQQTLSHKILARAAGKTSVTPGEIIWAKVGLAMMTDSSGPRRIQANHIRLKERIWDKDKVVVISDHFVPAHNEGEALIQRITRQWVEKHGIQKYHYGEGICHIIPVERGYIRPGTVMVGADSHTPTGGALGAFAVGVGSTEILGVIVTGEIWLKVPRTIRVWWDGKLNPAVMAKDMMLRLIGEIGDDGASYQAVEYSGPGVKALSLDERLVLSNMTTELGGEAGIIEPDELVLEHLRAQGQTDFDPLYADPDAEYDRELGFDASLLEPLVACPPNPSNVFLARELAADKIRLDQAYIGACTGAKYTDLVAAAEIVKGQQIAPGLRFLVAPASRQAFRRALADGTISTLVEAGATVLPTGCGACAGLGNGILASGERAISSTNRNYPGRMGARDSEVYLASPRTVAASALAGHIVDPREFEG